MRNQDIGLGTAVGIAEELSMQWLGHASEKVHSKYIHTYEGIMREIQAKEMDWSDED